MVESVTGSSVLVIVFVYGTRSKRVSKCLHFLWELHLAKSIV